MLGICHYLPTQMRSRIFLYSNITYPQYHLRLLPQFLHHILLLRSPTFMETQRLRKILELWNKGPPVNHTKVKLQRSSENTRRMLHSSPGSSKSPRHKDHSQDTLSPETSSSESAKAGDNRSKTSRYACCACSKTFARRADIPRHMQSACSVVGKNHLLHATRVARHIQDLTQYGAINETGYCIGKVVPLRKSGRRC